MHVHSAYLLASCTDYGWNCSYIFWLETRVTRVRFHIILKSLEIKSVRMKVCLCKMYLNLLHLQVGDYHFQSGLKFCRRIWRWQFALFRIFLQKICFCHSLVGEKKSCSDESVIEFGEEISTLDLHVAMEKLWKNVSSI